MDTGHVHVKFTTTLPESSQKKEYQVLITINVITTTIIIVVVNFSEGREISIISATEMTITIHF
jgi:hypothetical protein